jgi:hypothetical protein
MVDAATIDVIRGGSDDVGLTPKASRPGDSPFEPGPGPGSGESASGESGGGASRSGASGGGASGGGASGGGASGGGRRGKLIIRGTWNGRNINA